ncbi:MAG: cytochrome c [Planctomycetota bacterium]
MLRLRALVLMGPLTCLLLGVAGCRQEATVVFEPNLVHAMKYQIKEGIDMQQASSDAHWIVTEMFGTPNDPKLPAALTEDEELASIVSMDNLVKASGDPAMEGRGLYRKHCVLCHGIAGDGRGTSAAILNPYPRDYRRGIFKFKSTARGAKPLHEDLHGLIANGIPGSAMVKIPGLTDEDVDALVDYTIYLSMRGELERTLIDDAIFELDLEGGDRIIDPLAANADEESEERELFDEGWEIAED